MAFTSHPIDVFNFWGKDTKNIWNEQEIMKEISKNDSHLYIFHIS